MTRPTLTPYVDPDGRGWVDVTWPAACLICLRSGSNAITAFADDSRPDEIGDLWCLHPRRPWAVPAAVREALLPVLLVLGLLLGLTLRNAWALT